jgi:hypothetical protein
MPPKSGNEDSVAFMRRINICEELGSGYLRVARRIRSAGQGAEYP